MIYIPPPPANSAVSAPNMFTVKRKSSNTFDVYHHDLCVKPCRFAKIIITAVGIVMKYKHPSHDGTGFKLISRNEGEHTIYRLETTVPYGSRVRTYAKQLAPVDVHDDIAITDIDFDHIPYLHPAIEAFKFTYFCSDNDFMRLYGDCC